MREILFRGKEKLTGKWREGSLLKYPNAATIKRIYGDRVFQVSTFDIILETVGQYTGLTDKNGTKIFEGDIVHWKKVPYFVRWDSKKAEFVFADDMDADYYVAGFNEYTTSKFCKVIGNVHDNPELLNK